MGYSAVLSGSSLFRKTKKKEVLPQILESIHQKLHSPCDPIQLSMVQYFLTAEEQCAMIDH